MPIALMTKISTCVLKVITRITAVSLLLAPVLPRSLFAVEKQISEKEQQQVFSYITPPIGWEIADPKFLAKSVQIAFLKKSGAGFCPSVNLAIEKSNLSLSEYLNVIRQIHEIDKRNRWRQLGKVHTQSGIGQLTEIDTETEFGPVRMLQLILVKQGCTYVVTAAALKEEIAQYYKDFQATFRSLQITSDLISTVPQMERRDFLKERCEHLISCWQQAVQQGADSLLGSTFQKEQWVPFQNAVLQDFKDMGPHWQILVLKNIQEKMIALVPQNKENLEPTALETIAAREDQAEPELVLEERFIADEEDASTQIISISDDQAEPDLVSEEHFIAEESVETAIAEEIAEEIVLNEESSLEEDLLVPTEHVCHADEVLPNSPSTLCSETLIEDGQNTP